MTQNGSVRSEALAIVGLSCLFPKAASVEQFWQNLRDGVDAITEVPATHWNPDDYFDADPKQPDMTYARRGGFLEPVAFDPLEFGISPNNLEAIDTSQLLGLVAAKRVLEDAGYGPDREFDRNRVACILGVTGTLEMVIPLGARLGHPRWKKALAEAGVAPDVADDVIARIGESYVPWQENSFPGLLGNVVAGRIANKLDLHGTNCVVDAACASSLSALHLACLELWTGRADLAITGGVDTFNDIFMYMCFSKTPALSPSGDAKPFSENADGTILGEGVGMMAIKRLSDAERDGDRIYAVIRGIGTSSDGAGSAVYAPKADGQIRCLEDAYRTAGVEPDTIELIEAHGTGTKVGDATEVSGLMTVFSRSERQRPWCAIGSVKSQIGHTKAAAGVAGVIKAVLALRNRVLPPTIKIQSPPAAMLTDESPFFVNTQALPWLGNRRHPRRAGVSAFGFGGSNFHCVLEESPQPTSEAAWTGDVQIIALSGPTPTTIRQKIDAFARGQSWSAIRRQAARTRSEFRASDPHRLLVVVEQGRSDLGKILADARGLLESRPDQTSWTTPDGAFYGSGAKTGRLAVLFPGQGSQYPHMLRDLACTFPAMREVLEDADEAVEPTDVRLGTAIYPRPAWDDETRRQQAETLRATDVAQPAIGAVSLGALSILDQFGVKPELTGGHSYGELTALCASKRFGAEALYRLSRLRGRLMAEAQEIAGGMLAVGAPLEMVEEAIREAAVDVVIANRNGPSQVVLSGRLPEIERAEDLFARRNVRGRRLQVAAAFHSPLVASASTRFREVLGDVDFQPAEIPVFGNTLADEYPADPEEARDLLAGQLARPVEFVRQIENMLSAGAGLFLEVGPGNTLTGLVQSILSGRNVRAISLDASSGKKRGLVDLANTLATIAAWGGPVDLTPWDTGTLPREAEVDPNDGRLRIPLSGANYVKPRTPRPPKPPAKAPVAAPAPAIPTASAPPAKPSPAPARAQASVAAPEARPAAPSVSVAAKQTSVIPAPSAGATKVHETPATMTASPAVLQSLALLQQLQTDTARLHQQFLVGQEETLRTMERVLGIGNPTAPRTVAAPAMPQPVMAPAPVVLAPPAPVAAIPAAPVAPPPVQAVVAAPPPRPVEVLRPAAPAPVAAKSAPVAAANDQLSTVLLSVVAEKTGYPPEMLRLGMTLDHDLGIDSIKRVEILSGLQEKLPHLPAVKPEDLGTLRTLEDIVALLAGAVGEQPAVPSAPSVTPSAADGALAETLLAVVAEKTGYPPEMLRLGMTLDHDLGIDSIKRVEILSGLQEKLPQLPAVKPEDLGTLRTLEDIVALLAGSVPVVEAPHSSGQQASSATSTNGDLAGVLLSVVAEKTGYPPEMLRLGMTLDHDLGIDSIKRVEILSGLQEQLPQLPAVKPEDLGTLRTLEDIVALLAGSPGIALVAEPPQPKPTPVPVQAVAPTNEPTPAPVASPLERCIVRPVDLSTVGPRPSRPKAGGDWWVSDDGSELSLQVVRGLADAGCRPHLIALDSEPIDPPAELNGLIVIAAEAGTTVEQHWQAIRWLQAAGPRLKEHSGQVATVSRLDGACGFGSTPIRDPLSGGLSGLSKTVRHEWPMVSAKAIDLGDGWSSPADAADAVVKELLIEGPAEVGITPQRVVGLEVVLDQAVANSSTDESATSLSVGDLVIVTGGARGVTAASLIAVSRRMPLRIAILGRSPVEEAEADWSRELLDARQLRTALIERAEQGATPRDIDRRLQEILAGREVRATLATLEAQGCEVSYHAVDVRDAEAVVPVIQQLRLECGPVRGIIHGAGVLADQTIEGKTRDAFDRVLGTKIDGLANVLRAINTDELKLLAVFSSFTARYGRTGQLDYAIANESLNKLSQDFARRFPSCRVASFNWGPWQGGMVTPGLKSLFEAEGVGLIGLNEGADLFARDVLAARGPCEIVVLAGPEKPAVAAPSLLGIAGLQTAAAVAAEPVEAHPAAAIPRSMPRVAMERELDLDRAPCLASHVLGKQAVFPVALLLEWLSQAALHGNPGLEFVGASQLRVFRGIRLSPSESLRIRLAAEKPRREGGEFRVPVQLVSVHGDQLTPHAAAEVILAGRAPSAPEPRLPLPQEIWQHGEANVYDRWLFHGPAFQGLTRVERHSDEGILVRSRVAPAPAEWFREPLRPNWIADPLSVDVALQAVILWCQEHRGSPCLPSLLGEYRQFVTAFPPDVRVNVQITDSREQLVRADVEWLSPENAVLATLTGSEHVVDKALAGAFRANALA